MATIKQVNQKIETFVVDGYKKVEDSVVSRYQKIEDFFVSTFLAEEGETPAEAKARIAQHTAQFNHTDAKNHRRIYK